MVNASGASGYDFFTGGFVGNTSSAATRATRDYRNTMNASAVLAPEMKLNPKTGMKEPTGRMVPAAGVKTRVTITIHNLSGGLNISWGVAREPSPYYPYSALDRAAATTLDSRDLGTLCLPLKATAQQASASASTAAMFSVNAFNSFAIGTGGVANASLFAETSSTNPALTALTFTPGSAITCLRKIHIGGAGEYVAIGLTGGATKVISDFAATPTSVGTMNASTNPMWDVIESPLNSTTPGAGTLVMLNGTSLSTLGTENAIGIAPTAALTNLPGGGRIVGMVTMTGEPARIVLQLPRTNLAVSMFTTLGATPAKLYTVNLEGTDLQELRLPITNVYYAEILNNTIIASDGISVIQVDGTNGTRDLGWVTQRPASSNTPWRIGGLCNANGVLRVIAMNKGNGGSITSFWNIEEYDPSNGSWHNRTLGISETGSGLGSATGSRQLGLLFTAGPGQGFSEATGFHHILRCGTGALDFTRQYVPAYGQATFYTDNNTFGSGASTGQVFDAGAVVSAGQTTNYQSPAMVLEGFEGLPFVLEEVRFLGDLALGNTTALGAQWRFDMGQQKAPSTFGYDWTADSMLYALFSDSGNQRTFVKSFDDNIAWQTRFQYKVSLTQGSNTRQTPNGLPFQIKLLVFEDVESVRSPASVRAAA